MRIFYNMRSSLLVILLSTLASGCANTALSAKRVPSATPYPRPPGHYAPYSTVNIAKAANLRSTIAVELSRLNTDRQNMRYKGISFPPDLSIEDKGTIENLVSALDTEIKVDGGVLPCIPSYLITFRRLDGVTVQFTSHFDVDVAIDSDVASCVTQFSLAFDPTRLRVTEITEGPFYKDWAAANGTTTTKFPSWNVDNQKGTVTAGISVFIDSSAKEPVGRGVLATIHVTAQAGATGLSSLALENVNAVVLNDYGSPVDLRPAVRGSQVTFISSGGN